MGPIGKSFRFVRRAVRSVVHVPPGCGGRRSLGFVVQYSGFKELLWILDTNQSWGFVEVL